LDGAQLQCADLLHARLEGANLSRADLAGADLRAANLWGADLSDAQLQGADLQGAAIWLASFPVDLARQAPAPLGIAHLKLKPPAAHETAELQRKLQNNIYDLDQALLGHLWRLNQILQNDGEQWEDADRWSEYVGQAKDPSSDETVEFLTDLACGDSLGHIANNMALRAKYLTTGLGVGRDYAKPLAQALLNENCKGAKALSHETRAMLENLVSETEGGN
jgi:hypothetical protein